MSYRILVIDGQGGNLGCQLIKLINEQLSNVEIHAVGTNSMATSNMLKTGTVMAATGENAVIVATRIASAPAGLLIHVIQLGLTVRRNSKRKRGRTPLSCAFGSAKAADNNALVGGRIRQFHHCFIRSGERL